MSLAAEKSHLRAEIRSKRTGPRPLADAALASHCATLAAGRELVAAYSPLAGEPGYEYLVTALAKVTTLVLPITRPDRLEWAIYTGELRPGVWEIGEPTGAPVDPAKLDLFLIPGLAYSRAGIRLGQGGGYYDRMLDGSAVPRAGVVYSSEVLEEVPHNDHDLRVQWIITEQGTETLGSAV